ncbi:MAG: hypothetical protein IPL79_05305 [Myxococcales bacterium]|nr:hypothetical protein [Myxococcales bacterium]
MVASATSFVVLLLALWRAPDASAQGFFATSPGALSQSHASIDTEANCNDCHDGGRAVVNSKCLGCHDHKQLKARVDAGKGLHASGQVRGKSCGSCHLEHKGRSYDIMGWKFLPGGEQGFDHALAGWRLEGKHGVAKCADCHKDRNRQGLRTYVGVDRLCGSCHKEDQPHGFDRREMLACERCHSQSVWKPPRSSMEFDHNDKKDAAVSLVGSHEDVSCAKCHPKALFNLPKGDSCENCHQSPHDGHLFGKRSCEWCHSPAFRSLDKFKFDHDRRTKFDLGSTHGKLDCYGCHTKPMGTKTPPRACEACHADDNKHGDRFKAFGSPPSCGTCHPSSSWRPTMFNHDRQTSFKLTGAHATASCRDCHRGKNPSQFERFDAKKVGCMGCHQHKAAHNNEYPDSKCLSCHKTAGKINFDPSTVDKYHGPKARFPLTKGHNGVQCSQCHTGGKFKDTPMECGTRCHQDSLHKGSLGQVCSTCHTPGVWAASKFDHTEHTDWPLRGLHAKVPECADCHPTRQYTDTPTNCSAEGCHAKDDAHAGRLGQGCERCHTETGDNLFAHNTMSSFKLTGEHLDVACVDCHPSVKFKPRPNNCYGCHDEPEVHAGQYGTTCERCHTTKGFFDIRPLHDVGDFSLNGAHALQACERCHKDNRPMAGTGNLCINCHRQDDIHANSLSPKCGDCHTQWSFTPARFDHSTVGCNLTGLHRTLTCNDCHTTGGYGNISPTCVACHRNDAAIKGGPHAGYATCANCHNPSAWLPTTASGRESVCR